MPRETIDVGGRRRAFLHVVPTTPRADAPLLLALHGTSQQGTTMQRFSGRTLDALAERIGADLVYLDGYRRAWNDGRITRTSAAQRGDIDDVGFVRAVVEHFGRPALGIGYSNGGQLVHRVLREEHGLLRGAAIIAAGIPVAEDFAFEHTAPDEVPVILFHGTADPIVPYAGGATKMLGRTRGTVRSARETAEAYAPGATPTTVRDGGIERMDWGRVRLVTQVGTGHIVPNRRTKPPALFVGPSHQDLDAGEEIAAFFLLGV